MKWYLLAASIFSSPAFAGNTLWTEWYLVTQKGAPLSYFQELAESRPKDNQLAITQKWVEKIDSRSETYIGAVSQAESLEPVAFYVDRKGGSKPYKTDGRTVGKKIEITFKPGTADLSKSTEFTSLVPGMYLSSFVPMALARKFGKTKDPLQFTAVVEDAGEMNVEIKKGTAEIQGVDKKIGKESCHKVLLTFDGKVQVWWIAKSGKTCLVEFPDSATKMEIVTEKTAKKALKEPN